MEGRISLARSAAIRFLDGLREDDVTAVYTFHSKVEQMQDFSQSRDLTPRTFGLNPTGMTVLYDAVARAATDLARRPEKRRAILVLSDGEDTQSAATLDKALSTALNANATIYTVDMADREPNLIKLQCSFFFTLALCATVRPQQSSQIKPPPSAPPDLTSPRGSLNSDQSSPTEEMLKSTEIKRLEMMRKENLERARETAQLGAEICEAFEQHKSLGASEMKKVGRIEKLARSIRNEAGGDDDDEGLKDPPAQLGTALRRLSEMCEDLRKKVEKTPRQVVSATVIASANQLIALAKHIRTFGGK
jgi:hypothetical protein